MPTKLIDKRAVCDWTVCRQEERGGGAMFSSGDVVFHERTYFIGNGQFEQDGLEAINQPGGAIVNIGTMEASKVPS